MPLILTIDINPKSCFIPQLYITKFCLDSTSYSHLYVRGCSPEHFPPLLTLSRPLRTTLLRACFAARLTPRRGRSPFSRPFARFSPLFPLRSSRLSPRLALCFSGRCAQHCSLQLASSPSHVGCSPDHFPLARLPLRRRCSRVLFASFIRALGSLLLSLRSALLCSAHAFALLVPRLLPLLSLSSLSRLDTPHHID